MGPPHLPRHWLPQQKLYDDHEPEAVHFELRQPVPLAPALPRYRAQLIQPNHSRELSPPAVLDKPPPRGLAACHDTRVQQRDRVRDSSQYQKVLLSLLAEPALDSPQHPMSLPKPHRPRRAHVERHPPQSPLWRVHGLPPDVMRQSQGFVEKPRGFCRVPIHLAETRTLPC